MNSFCRRCYVKNHPELKKKDIKNLVSTTDKYKCDGCNEYKSIVIERKPREEIYYEDDIDDW